MALRPGYRAGCRREADMTEGGIAWHLIRFSLPLVAGNLFQQMYSMVDTWVVGNYVSNEAYSAVGAVSPVINVLIGFFMGLASGAGVVISQHYGAAQHDNVRKATHTAMMLTVIMSVFFMILGVGITPAMLTLMRTPLDVYDQAKTYLLIYFLGIGGMLFYNMGAGILRSVGDSVRPFYFLIVSAVINTVLDLLFVLKFGMGVEGVALATIIAQFVSAGLIVRALLNTDTCVQLRIRELRIHWDTLRKVIVIGIPAAIQMAVTSFSNVFIQSYINYFGKDFMSGWTTFLKVDQLLLVPIQCLALAVTTFVGQNFGKNQLARARKGVSIAFWLSVLLTVVLTVPVMIFAPHVVQFFIKTPAVIEYGAMLLRCIVAFHLFSCSNQIFSGALRGAGKSRVPMIIMLGSFVLFRQIYMFVVSNFIVNEPLPVIMGYPLGWVLCGVVMWIYYRRSRLVGTYVAEENTVEE